MIKAQYTKRNHMLSIIDTNCSRKPTVSAKTGCVDLVFEDDETAIAVRVDCCPSSRARRPRSTSI